MSIIKFNSVDELNNMHLEDLQQLEDKIFNYFKRIKAVRKFTEEILKED